MAKPSYYFNSYKHLTSGDNYLGFYGSAINDDVENESFCLMIGS
jgi:hypothetical protein